MVLIFADLFVVVVVVFAYCGNRDMHSKGDQLKKLNQNAKSQHMKSKQWVSVLQTTVMVKIKELKI